MKSWSYTATFRQNNKFARSQLGKSDLDKLKKEIESVAAKFATIPDELAYI